MNILEVKIDNLARYEILGKIEFFLSEPKFHQVATVNPEFILEAQKNSEFRKILNNCDLNIADSIGIKLAFWRYGWNLKSRIAGADLMQEILKIANIKNLKIFLAINKNGLSSFEEIKSALLKTYPNLQIDGTDLEKNTVHCLPAGRQGSLITDHCILFCNFGAPHQEIFLNSQKDAKIRLAMGVGGAFDFLTGKVKRAPIFMRQIGLEWLWRLLKQPKRIKRILNAVIVFPIKVLLCKEK